MRGASSMVWALLLGGILLGFGAVLSMKRVYGPAGGPAQGLAVFEGARKIDQQAMSRLQDLGIRFAREEKPGEPVLDLENPTEADFAFLESVLASNDPGARVSAAKVLRDIGNPRAVEPLIGAIRGIEDIDRFLLECALTVVNGVPHDARAAALVPAWEKHRARLHDDTREALRFKMRDVGALDQEYLRSTAVRHPDPVFRRFAVRELAAGAERPRGIFAAALADADDEVRSMAAAALAAVPQTP